MKYIAYALSVLGSIALFNGSALALDPPSKDRFLEEQWVRCGEHDLTIWGRKQDLRLTRGEDGILEVKSGDVTLICGREQLRIRCNQKTRMVWVKRTSDRNIVVTCYS